MHDYWVIDSSAIDHISKDQNLVLDFKILYLPSQISAANDDRTPVIG